MSREPIGCRPSAPQSCLHLSSEHTALYNTAAQAFPALEKLSDRSARVKQSTSSIRTWLFFLYRNKDRILSTRMSVEGVKFLPHCESLEDKRPRFSLPTYLTPQPATSVPRRAEICPFCSLMYPPHQKSAWHIEDST